MTSSFRQRSASALTHPVTVAAVAALLLNDLLFKLLWPGHWVTGKLSDLAWVVFAPPLLALLLSLLTFRKPLPERAAFATAYAGLPLAYLIFNSSEAVHRWALSALLPLTGSATGSPFDPTDSLVILPALALALWVWRQTPARPESVRMRLYLFAAVAMALATIATSVEPRSQSQWLVGISDRGTVVMEGPSHEQYESDDGGITWVEVPRDQPLDVEWGRQEATTPRGTYAIRGYDIVLLRPGEQSTVAYSASYLQEEANRWAQKYSTQSLRDNISRLYDDPEEFIGRPPLNLVYDTRTASLIAGVALDGVIVGDSEGQWVRVGVGRFVPTDFSFQGKARLMLSSSFWYATLAVSLSLMAMAFIFSSFRLANSTSIASDQNVPASPRTRKMRWTSGLSLLTGVAVLILLFMPDTRILLYDSVLYNLVSYLTLSLLVSLPCLLGVFALSWPRQNCIRAAIAVFFGVIGVVLSLAGSPPYGGDLGVFSGGSIRSGIVITGLLFALLGAVVYFPRKSELPAYAIGLLAMVALVPLPFLLWLAGRVTLAVASMGALALLVLAAGAFFGYLVRTGRSGFPPSRE